MPYSIFSSRVFKVVVAGLGALLLVLTIGVLRPHPTVERAATVDAGRDESDTIQVLSPSSLPDSPPAVASMQSGWPAGLYVSNEVGVDGNDGLSPDTPIPSLQQALNQVTPGQVVYVMNGRYSELALPGDHHYVVRNGGRPDAWVRVANAPGHSPVVVPYDGNGIEVQADYVEIQGLTIEGEGFDPEGDPWGTGILIRNSHDVRVVSNTISGMPVSGISSVESTRLSIVDNEVFENSFWSSVQGSGISLWRSKARGLEPDADGYRDRIMGNRIYRNENKVRSRWQDYQVITDGNGIIIDETNLTEYPGRILIANNVIFDNGGRAVVVFKSGNVDVFHNTVYHNGRTESLDGGPVELAAARAGDVRFVNNLVWPRPDVPGLQVSEAENVSSGGNLIVANGNEGDYSDSDTVIDGDPVLGNATVDEATANFRPLQGSAAMDAAVSVEPSLRFDIIGRLRSARQRTVGAYEIDRGGN